MENLEFGHYYHIYNRGNNREKLFYEPWITKQCDNYPYSSYQSILPDKYTRLKNKDIIKLFDDKEYYIHYQQLDRLVNGYQDNGKYMVRVEGISLDPGVYTVALHLRAGGDLKMKTLKIIRGW